MSSLNPTGDRRGRAFAPPRRRRRHTGPWLTLLTVLAVITIVVWWKVLGTQPAGPVAACGAQPTTQLAKVTAKSVQVRVYNGTTKSGLAKTVATDLTKRGFTIAATGNDPLGRTLTGSGEIRYGPSGTQQALLLSFQIPGVTLHADNRTDAVVDFAIGPGYTALASQAKASQARSTALASAAASPGC